MWISEPINNQYIQWVTFFLQQVLIPILLIFAMSYMSNDPMEHDNKDERRAMNLGMFKDVYQPRVFYKLNSKDHVFLKKFKRFGTVDFKEMSNITDGT